MTDSLGTAEKLELARRLVGSLEQGAEDEANELILELSGDAGNQLFQEVGRLTRELHDAMNHFLADSDIADIAKNEIPDARERLQYVITLTEQSANSTLEAVETAMPLVASMGDVSAELRARVDALPAKGELSSLRADLRMYLDRVETDTKQIQSSLSDVLMAQSFQDLTGQVIRRVIEMVQELEIKLVELVKIAGSRLGGETKEKPAKDDQMTAFGPAVPGVEHGEVVSSQDEVDDLLSELGF